jgi:hypothetical protein
MKLTKRRSKKLKKLEDEHAYLDRKVAQLTKDRLKDRSSESKEVLTRLKRTKLMIKDAIAYAKKTLTKESNDAIRKTWTESKKQARVRV